MSTSPQTTPSSDIGALISQSFNLYFQRFAQYIMVAVATAIPAYVVTAIINALTVRAALGSLGGGYGSLGAAVGASFLVSFLTGIIEWTAFGIAIGIVAVMVEAGLKGKALSLGEAFKAIPVGPLAITAVVFGLAVALGSLLLVLPGIAAGFFFCLALPATALDKEGLVTAFTRAAKAALRVPAELAIVLVIFFIYFFVAGAIAVVFAFLGGSFGSTLFTGIFLVFALPWFGIALTLCYDRAKKLGA